MSSDEASANKSAAKRFHDAINSRDLATVTRMIDEMVAPDLKFHAPVPIGAEGPEALKRVMTVLLEAFPDLQVKIEDLIAEGDRVVARNRVTGTNNGSYMNRPPTGRSVQYNEIFILRFAAGRVAEIWGVVDALSQMKQLGLIPA